MHHGRNPGNRLIAEGKEQKQRSGQITAKPGAGLGPVRRCRPKTAGQPGDHEPVRKVKQQAKRVQDDRVVGIADKPGYFPDRE